MDDSEILKTAQEQYTLAKDVWSEIYQKAKDDLHFLSDEPYAQWNEDEANARTKIGRPALQIDQLSQFVHQVENDIRMNTPTIKVIPDTGGADQETAEIFQGLIKNIEYKSKADAAYDTAASNAIRASIGFIRVDTQYTDDNGFEQELVIKRVVNPLSIYLDPSSTEPDGCDAMFAFAMEDITRKEFERRYPKANPVSFGDEKPVLELKEADTLTIVEYFVVDDESTEMGLTDDGEIEPYDEKKSYKSTRKISKRKILRYRLSGQDVLEKTTFPGKYIPIVPVYGEEAWIEGKRNLYSLIRKSKSSQRMYNLWASLETELLTKQQQAPVQAAIGQMEGFEDDWKSPEKAMVLYYKQTDVDGNPAPPPQRLQPPQIPTGIVNARRETVDDIKATLGMYNASIGQRSNETSGVAIDARKKEGDVATFHFADNTVRGVTQVGKIIVCAAPEVYDTSRIIKIISEEDETQTIGINGKLAEEQERHFDLTKGSYDVRVITGPSFTTQRQEAAQMYSQLIQAMPDLMPVIGDLVFKYQDAPGSQAISNRLRKLVDPKLLTPEEQEKNQPDPQVQALQTQLQQVVEQSLAKIQELEAELQQKDSELKNKQADTMVKMAEVQVKEQEVQVKKAEANIKYLQVVQQPEQAPETTMDEPVEVLHAKIQKKISDKQMAEQQAQEQAQQAMIMQQMQEQKEQEEAAMKQQQANAIIGVLGNISEQLAMQTAQTAKLANQVSKPIQVIRDETGNIIGAS